VPAPLFGWMHEKPRKEARWCNCLDAGRRRAPGVADLPGGAGRRHARDRGATARCRSTGRLPAALAGLTAGGRGLAARRTRPSAARTVNVETPVAAAICRSVCPAASSPAIRAASAGVSFDAPFGPRRTGTSPATPPQAERYAGNLLPVRPGHQELHRRRVYLDRINPAAQRDRRPLAATARQRRRRTPRGQQHPGTERTTDHCDPPPLVGRRYRSDPDREIDHS
jgi:hypothetical protein